MKISHALIRSMAGLLAGALLTVSAQAAPLFSWGGSDYFLTDALPWNAAEAEAVILGGHLATINSAEEQMAIADALGDGEWRWIGLNDATEEGNWAWASGEAVTYTNWAPGEPNQSGGQEDHVNIFSDGTWNDFSGSSRLQGVVEVKQEVPEPGSLALAGLALAGLAAGRRRKS